MPPTYAMAVQKRFATAQVQAEGYEVFQIMMVSFVYL